MKGIVLIMVSVFLSPSGAQDDVGQQPGSSLSYCQPDTCTLIRELAVLKEKLGAVETRLQASESQMVELKSVNKAQDEELKTLKDMAAARQPKVAFSAALRTSGSGNIGPFNTDAPLQYKRVFSNFGSGYNPATGIFTAMVKGVYYFRYTMFYSGKPNAVVSLQKNGQMIVSSWDVGSGPAQDFASNAAVTELVVGDNVYVQLSANREVFEDTGNYNTFSGFLLFTT